MIKTSNADPFTQESEIKVTCISQLMLANYKKACDTFPPSPRPSGPRPRRSAQAGEGNYSLSPGNGGEGRGRSWGFSRHADCLRSGSPMQRTARTASTVTQKYRNMKRRLFPHGCVARRCHSPCYVASSCLALRKNPSVSSCSAISESQY